MICPECNAELHLIVDGQEMSEEQLLALPFAPKKIERRMNHHMWCTRIRSEGWLRG